MADALEELDETVTVAVNSITNATGVGPQELAVTILNVAPPVVPDVTLAAAPAEIAEAGGVAAISATLSEITSVPVKMSLSVAATGTATVSDDYALSGLDISIAPGDTSGSVTITAVQDEIDEPDESVTLEIVNISGGTEVGEQAAGVTILDDDRPTTFQVVSLSPTASGFTAELSGEVEAGVLNLYDSQAAGLGPADVVLRGAASGMIAGSLVVHPSLRRVTFVKSSGPLSADTYTVTLRSGANEFKDAAGDLLDGDRDGATGGDYEALFSVASVDPAVVVSLPDFVRGPGQNVRLPADTTDGIPLSISNGIGVRNVEVHINYDPALLAITAATVGPAMPPGATVELNVGIVPGLAIVTFSSPADLPAGSAPPFTCKPACRRSMLLGSMVSSKC